ncbi:nonsense-mediated mRNA decay factor SMG7 isoform X12 [Panthera uncia]|uniref:nonsense-mediated mRNA decay factor SMG7 isoform X12 n=1 Tax=Panthera uncia TaxID=29064 RepID=UPI0020FF997B|nr:nonsense-mediated mRNA decay factor SMG7 isoform X12 [Panthera uncia]
MFLQIVIVGENVSFKSQMRTGNLKSEEHLKSSNIRQAEVLKADMTDSKLGPAEVWTSRQALQDLYQKMLVTDLEYALDKKVEQDLWNHAFKNQITTLQGQAKNRANPNRSEVQANLSLFLEAASGFYTQLLQELCTVFNVDLPCRVKSSQLGIISNKQTHTSAIVKPQSSSCSYICQHCLVHLGDIARYRNQTSQAESYYRHAAQLVPSNGQPYNQLAILASSKGDHLTTIFYYCRSIAVKFPFPAASTNLQKALSKALESRDEVKTKWSVSDFIKAFIKFHGHVYLSKSLEKLSPLREKLEEQFKRLLFQKAFNSQQLVHVTVINLFQLHHLRDFSNETEQHSYSQDEQLCWTQLLALFMSFLGILCKCPLQNKSQEESYNAYPLPAVKVSMDWLRLRPRVFQEAVVDERQYIWPWLISLLNSFHPHEEDLSSTNATPLPEEFELQGFLALRPSFRNLDFSKGHQGITGDKEGQQRQIRQQRLISIGKWIADNQPRLIQCENEVGKLLFITEIPELILEDPSEAKENLILQETSMIESLAADGNPGLKSVLSTGRNLSNNCDTGEKPMVTFKENIKPREVNRDQGRSFPPKEVKSQTELRKTPVSEARKTPVTQTPSQASNSQFIPIHHPGAFPPLPSRPGFPPPTYVIPPPVAFSMGSGYTFPAGVSVPGTFLQPTAHSPAGNQVQAGKQSHIPYSQQRPSGPGPMNQGPQQPQPPSQQPLTSLPAQPTAQSTSQLQVQALAQQQSPTKAVPALGKSPPHHSGFQQKSLLEKPSELMSHSSSFLSLTGFSLNQERYPNNSMFNEVYGKNLTTGSKTELNPSLAPQETSLYSLFEGTPWSPSLPASSDHSTPASQSPHSSNPSSLPSSPPTHNHNSVPFSNFGPIGTPDNRDRRTADRWKTDKPAMGGFGIDYLSATSASESSWHQASTPSGTWTGHGPSMEDSSAVLMESLKISRHLTSADKLWAVFQSIWSSSMMHPGPSALEQLLMQQKQKQQRGQGAMNPPH